MYNEDEESVKLSSCNLQLRMEEESSLTIRRLLLKDKDIIIQFNYSTRFPLNYLQ